MPSQKYHFKKNMDFKEEDHVLIVSLQQDNSFEKEKN
jgi:hypothetical protein